MVKGKRKGQKNLAYSHKLSDTNLELLKYLRSWTDTERNTVYPFPTLL